MSATTAPHFRIARATLDDAGEILECVRAAFEPYRTQYTRAAYEDTVMTAGTVRRRIETMIVLVARDGGGPVIGTVGGLVRGDEGHIRGMAVLPSSQGRGVADRLLETIEGALKGAGCSFVTLDTTDPLDRAIRFYERNGYTRSGIVSDFFGMRLHEYRKPLESN
jgi:ribosomal protein S18 acetylase RimI-like enzyme